MYVDVHAHIFHALFEGKQDDLVARAKAAGLEQVIVNGLEPESNRQVLALCEQHDFLLPALGIYPVDAIASEIAQAGGWEHDFPPPVPFDVDAEIDFIKAHADQLSAIGEIGLDHYWVKEPPATQERVFRRLVEVALEHDKPVIIHTRKAELKSFEILQEMQVKRANFHCYGGKLKLARRIAEAGYYLSIPAVVVRSESFQRLVQELPLESLLTETDCPYMSAEKGKLSEPAQVVQAIETMASIRGLSVEEMSLQIRKNFRRLFRI